MIVVPIVISSLVVGIAASATRKPSRIGLKTIIYFETSPPRHRRRPAAGQPVPARTGIDMSTLGTVDISQYQKTTQEVA